MITINTVFILGAGASKPYGYPTGRELRLEISKLSASRIRDLLQSSKEYSSEEIERIFTEASNFTKTFFNSSTPSIDLFLARNPHFSDIGKQAIIISILEAEKKSKFREKISDINQDWYSYLFHRLTDELNTPDSFKEIVTKTVSFITFNYDRSLEYFLCESFLNSFSSASEDRIINKLKQIPIYHVYGMIDKLPWQGGSSAYRKSKSIKTVMKMKDNIKIIHERAKEPSEAIEAVLKNAERIYFLGFGYAEVNLEVLGIPKILRNNVQICGTALGLYDREMTRVKNALKKNSLILYPNIEPIDCVSLLRKYL